MWHLCSVVHGLIHFAAIVRRVVLALFVLALIAPAVVDSGLQLQATPLFELTQDLEKSRCGPTGDQTDDQHAMSCCILCAAPQVPDGSSAALLKIAFRHFLKDPVDDRQQSALINQDLVLRHPIPRGPPAWSPSF
jgi:hypothetical protein